MRFRVGKREYDRSRSEPVIFTCQCGWVFVLNADFVVGPFYNNPSTMQDKPIRSGHVMTPEQFYDEYADCAGSFAHKPPLGMVRIS